MNKLLTRAAVVAASVLTLGVLAAPSAQAAPEPHVLITPVSSTVGGGMGYTYGTLTFSLADASDSGRVTTTLRAYGCGVPTPAVVKRVTYTHHANATVRFNPYRVGPHLRFTATSTAAGSTHHSRVTLGESVRSWMRSSGVFHCRPSALPAPLPASYVAHWSTKAKGSAAPLTGRTVAITPTTLTAKGKAAHARVGYTWKVGAKVVARKGLSLAVDPAWVGKTLTATATVSKAGMTPKTQTVSFGKVRVDRTPADGSWLFILNDGNRDPWGDAEKQLTFNASKGVLTFTNVVAVYGDTPVYAALTGTEQTTFSVKNGRLDATIHNVWVITAADPDGSHAGTVEIHLNFSDPNTVTGSYTITDPTLAPDGVTQDLGEMDKTFTPN